MSLTDSKHGKLAQLHPEELFDKEELGTLTSAERVRLDAHVSQCAACKMDRLLRADFEAEADERISFTNLVEGALGAVAKADGEQKAAKAAAAPDVPVATVTKVEPKPVEAPLAPSHRPTPWKRVALLFAAAFVLMATAAAASEQGRSIARKATSMFSTSDEGREKELAKRPASLTLAPAAQATPSPFSGAIDPLATASGATPTSSPSDGLTAPALEAATQPRVDPRSMAIGAPPQVHPATLTPVVRFERTPSAPSTPALNAKPMNVVEPAVVEPPAKSADDAAALFGAANDKRRSGNLSGALVAYADIITRFPMSREASTARVLRGRILLEQHDARRALAEFDTYLASGRGELREEALVGRARSFGMVGQADAERTAWDTLLTSYPRSASAEHARLRLEALGAH